MEQTPPKGYTSNKKLVIIVVIIVVLYFGYNLFQSFFGVNLRSFSTSQSKSNYSALPAYGGVSGEMVNLAAPSAYSELSTDTAPAADVSQERMVVQNSNLSLLVKDVKASGDKILQYAKDNGGYMVSSSYNRPTESPFATITIRVPSGKFEEAVDYFRSLAVKVTNENLQGTDVTDRYTNIEERLATLTSTKKKLESIMAMTNDVTEILRVQREIINLQVQIDNLTGQKKAMEQEVALTKITAYLSTDELSLPYTPDNKFRPAVVFKLAVRSLLTTLKSIGELLIWIAVYAVIWVPALIIYKLIKRWKKKKAVGS